MNPTLIWLLAIPIIGAALVYFKNQDTDFKFWLGPIAFLPGAIFIAIVFALSYGAAVSDTEIFNGQVTAKNRIHDSYVRSYSCNCTTDSKGATSCSTCYEDHYTVAWNALTTVGGYRIDHEDSTSRSVYDTPDPARYTIIQPGDPVAKEHTYTNYVQAVPNSLFAATDTHVMKSFASLLGGYPGNVYDFYHLDRFVTPGFSFTDAKAWNDDLSNMLRTLGPEKQVNVIVVIAKTSDPQYAFALREKWCGLKKNDVALVIGSLDGQHIEFVDVLSWTKNELFKIQLRDRVKDMGLIERTQIIAALKDQVSKNFERRHMKEFAYLKGEIDPPTWLIWLTCVVLVAGYAGGALYLNRVAGSVSRNNYGRGRFNRRF